MGVVVIGETPYAEMKGDRAELALAPEDIAAVKTMKAAGIPVVVVLVSGRPMILGDVLDQASAVVAAWLPGHRRPGRRRRALRRLQTDGQAFLHLAAQHRAGNCRAAIRLRLRPEVLSAVGQVGKVGNLRTDCQSVQASPARLIAERWTH